MIKFSSYRVKKAFLCTEKKTCKQKVKECCSHATWKNVNNKSVMPCLVTSLANSWQKSRQRENVQTNRQEQSFPKYYIREMLNRLIKNTIACKTHIMYRNITKPSHTHETRTWTDSETLTLLLMQTEMSQVRHRTLTYRLHKNLICVCGKPI